MNIWQFIFSFLYTRNWYTGARELSRPRVALFASMLFILLLGVLLAVVLQTPVVYEAGAV